ncbi:MAG: hypothetical protein A6F71_04565 [Cycloclasticus sp. symbiont of Poecilosclerida sp. M]|nr:MAG: hypothetical protein A6F71_04565 [Cycloclasticus sp. symbiont of Poecilosclerida sp. M]
MKYLYLLFFVFILAVGFVLSLLNSAPIKLDYYYGAVDLPLSFCIVVAFFIGVLFGFSTGVLRNIKLHNRCSKLDKEVRKAKKEVSNLRTLPIKKTI